MSRKRASIAFLITIGFLLTVIPVLAAETPVGFEPAEISGGAEAVKLAKKAATPILDNSEGTGLHGAAVFTPGIGFLAYDFDQNAAENGGFLFIPPDPIGAAGRDRVIAVVNVGIECRDKTGTLLWRDALRDFFAPTAGVGAGNLGSFTFDPKIVYDHYEDRFVAVTLEQQDVTDPAPTDESRILLAVSKGPSPATPTAADWWFWSIDSKVLIGGGNTWADYPGFEVDEEVIYITANMFPFATSGSPGGVRLWIVDKGVAGGFYSGGAAAVTVHDPYAGGGFELTTMPALVHGAGGIGPGIGTFLVGYSGLTFGGLGNPEAVQVVRVDNPLGAVTFTQEFVTVGNIEDIGGPLGFPALVDAPQSGTATRIEVNDRRALDAVWRDDMLWITTTITPNGGPDLNQTTAHWWKLNTSAVVSSASPSGLITLDQEGNIGGEDIAAGAYTFFPAVAVNGLNEAKFGFSASASSIFAGAYFAGREPVDPPGTVQASGTVRAGVDYYIRTFGGPRNRWGDYSGAAVDPSDDRTFWVFNEYAMTRGTPIGGEDGRWGTAWRSCATEADTACVELTCPPDTSGAKGQNISLQFCVTNCGTLPLTVDLFLTDDKGWCTPVNNPGVLVGPGATHCENTTCAIPVGACPPDVANLSFRVFDSVTGTLLDECLVTLTVVNQPPTALCQDVTVGSDANCQGNVGATQVDNGSFDPEGQPLTYNLVPPGPYAIGNTNVRLIVTDDCGAQDTCNAVVTVTNLPPVAVCKDITVFGGASPCSVNVAPTQVDDGSSDPEGQAINLSLIPPGPYPEGITPVELIVTDACGASDTCQANIEVICPTPDCDIDPTLVCFENVVPGDTVCTEITIYSTGTADLDINSVTGCSTDGFFLDLSALSTPVVPGDSTSFQVCFTPVGGPDSCEVTIDTNKGRVRVPVQVKSIVAAPDPEGRVAGLRLAPVAPNPFRSSTRVRFSLPGEAMVRLEVYDFQGRRVRQLLSEARGAGDYDVVWDGRDDAGIETASGIYFLKLTAGSERRSVRAVRIE